MSTLEKPSSPSTGLDGSSNSGQVRSSAAVAPSPVPVNTETTPVASANRNEAVPGLEKLGAGIRELVEAELAAAGVRTGKLEDAATPTVKPGPGDVLFLVVGVINLVLLVWMIPGEVLDDQRVKFLKELIPWIFGSLFVLVTTWYHDVILRVSRNKTFRVIDIALAVLLTAAWLPLITLPPVDPADAQLKVAPGERPLDLSKPTRVSLLQAHTYLLEKIYANQSEPYTRSFKLTGWELWREKSNNQGLHWSLLYPVRITANRKGIKLLISREGAAFDKDFLDNLDQYHLAKSSELHRGDQQVQFIAESNTETPRLPVGRYRLTAEGSDCTVTSPQKKNPPMDLLTNPLIIEPQSDTVLMKVDCN